MAFEIDFYSEKVKIQVASLPKTLLARFIALADRMEQYGPNLGESHTRSMGDGLFEMRLKGRKTRREASWKWLVKIAGG
jgi:Phage derived protein Gp49-like (DUF891)